MNNPVHRGSTPHPGDVWSELIDKRGFSQAQVARGIGCTAKHLNQLIKGHVLPSATLTVKFAAYCDVQPWQLWVMQARYTLEQAQKGERG